ncbi:hypothetical protein MNBD_NITROSPINAE01-437 [hydrothermal vent metagenome]|uniref:Response regulatory domain-containing protein n=1 Tax=hydrothermal vent metagenome TaxID=652676 RepID=A0A3B1CXU1_9ZZZZ
MAKILLAAESLDNIVPIKTILEANGHETMACPVAIDVLSIVLTEGMEIVILQLIEGSDRVLEIVRTIKNDDIAKGIPILLLANSEDEPDTITSGLEAGADDYMVEPVSNMELSTRIDTMVRLKDLGKNIKQARMVMKEEVDMAHYAQFAMLPTTFPYAEDVSFHTEYIATGDLGGDYYDVTDHEMGRIGIILADISGHGPSAALIVSILKSIWDSNKDMTRSPSMLAEMINDQLLRFTPAERFASLFHGIYNINDRSLNYVRCGHPYPFVLRKNGGAIERLEASGDFVGIHKDFYVEEETIRLEKGDRLLVYSDGLIESCDKQETIYGFDRLTTKLKDNFDMDGATLVSALVADTIEFCQGEKLPDDVTIMLMEAL